MNKKRIKTTSDSKLDEQVRKLIKARLRVIPSHLQVAVGSQEYSIKELLKSVEKENEVGKQLIEMQLQYLRDLASGKIYENF